MAGRYPGVASRNLYPWPYIRCYLFKKLQITTFRSGSLRALGLAPLHSILGQISTAPPLSATECHYSVFSGISTFFSTPYALSHFKVKGLVFVPVLWKVSWRDNWSSLSSMFSSSPNLLLYYHPLPSHLCICL